jgi:hypothetical protein
MARCIMDDEEPDIVVNERVAWTDENTSTCYLCDMADADGALSYLNDLRDSCISHTSEPMLWSMMKQSYEHFFKTPQERLGTVMPKLTINNFKEHYTEHDINAFGVTRKAIMRIGDMQEALCVRVRDADSSTGMHLDTDAARVWMQLEDRKGALMKMMRTTQSQLREAHPSLPAAPDIKIDLPNDVVPM